MANGIDYPMVNGFRHSWTGVVIKLGATTIYGVTEINYTTKQEKGWARGAGAQPIGKTLGNTEYEGDFSINLEEFNQLMAALSPNALCKAFDIVVSYTSLNDELTLIQDTLIGVTLESIESSQNNGSTDAIVRKIPIKPIRILYNGVNQAAPEPTAAA